MRLILAGYLAQVEQSQRQGAVGPHTLGGGVALFPAGGGLVSVAGA